MVFSKLVTSTSGNGGQFSSRGGATVDRIIIHHAASLSLFAVLDMMKYATRVVSSNYVIGNGGEIVGVVPEEYRAWTSGSTSWDGRSITVEIINESAGPDWRISDAAFDAVARMLADISARYGIKLSRTTVVTHQELYTIHGASYATACPGPYLQARIDELIKLASIYLAGGKSEEEEDEDDMWKPTVHLLLGSGGRMIEGTLAHPEIGVDLDAGGMRVEKTKPGTANVYRGFKASASKAVVEGWQAAYAQGPGTASSKSVSDRKVYESMQAAQTQMSVDLHGSKG